MDSSAAQILGIRFFNGDADQAVVRMQEKGGYLVAPSGTCFSRLRHDPAYRQAISNADLALPDSGAMVLFWRLLRGEKVNRISGLKYLQRFCAALERRNDLRVLWVVPNESARSKAERWLNQRKLRGELYVAPMYGQTVEDRQLLAKIESDQPHHVVIGIGSGPQEKLGHFLRDHLSYRPAIHCIGAALGFLTGDQVAIPDWADRFYLGWLLRLTTQPASFLPRLLRAFGLPWLIFRYGRAMPPLDRSARQSADVV